MIDSTGQSKKTERGLGLKDDESAQILKPSFSASYNNVPPRQLLELVLLTRRTAKISFRGIDGSEGQLNCANGEITHAAIDGAYGLQYVNEVLDISTNTAQVQFSSSSPATLGGGVAQALTPDAESNAHIQRPVPQPTAYIPRVEGFSRNFWLRASAAIALLMAMLFAAYTIVEETERKTTLALETARSALEAKPIEVATTSLEQPEEPLVKLPRVLDIDTAVDPAEAQVWLDGELLGKGRIVMQLPLSEQAHELRIAAKGFQDQYVASQGVAPHGQISLSPIRKTRRLRRTRSKRPINRRQRSKTASSVVRTVPKIELIDKQLPVVELITAPAPKVKESP